MSPKSAFLTFAALLCLSRTSFGLKNVGCDCYMPACSVRSFNNTGGGNVFEKCPRPDWPTWKTRPVQPIDQPIRRYNVKGYCGEDRAEPQSKPVHRAAARLSSCHSTKSAFLTFAALLCLSRTSFGLENGLNVDTVFVKEGSDTVLPCSLKNQNLNKALFDWIKVDRNSRKEVFLYVAGEHYNNNKRTGQDQQFKGRVSHFEDELQHGNASIKIHNTKVEDSGNYTCYFPGLDPPQTFYVELMVDLTLKHRSGSPGVTPAPGIKTVKATNDWWQLQCDVRGASPKPTVEWQNSDGKVLLSQEPQVTESEGRYNITLLITVNQTRLYRCVVTQEELHHQIHSETFVQINGVAAMPYTKTVDASDNWSQLQCDVQGASPKPTVEWKNSDGKVLHTQEPQITESEGRYDVTLLTTVKQTGLYRCVVTQEELHHQIHSETFVYISGGKKCASENRWWGGMILGLVGGVITFAAPRIWPVLRKLCRCGGSADSTPVSKVDEEAVPLSTKGPSVIRVEEGSDAVLKCSPGSQNLTGEIFHWRKVDPKDLKEVFLHDAHKHHSNGINGHGHISHFGDELQEGNASIKISNTKVEDRGIYTCHFPRLDPPQIFCLELVVVDSNDRLLNSSTSEV